MTLVALLAVVLGLVLWAGARADDATDGGTTSADGDAPPSIAFVGDSLTVGVGAADGESYAWRTAEVLGWPVALVDGVSGSGYVAPGGGEPIPARADDVVAAGPDVVVVVAGNNDVFRGHDPDEVGDAARELFAALGDGLPDAELVVVGPFPNRLDEVADPTAVRERIRDAADDAGAAWLDPRDMLAEELGDPAAWARYLSEDGVHPNADGYRLIGDALAERLPELVG